MTFNSFPPLKEQCLEIYGPRFFLLLAILIFNNTVLTLTS